MSVDLQMLAWTAGLTAVLWLPYILAHIANVGVLPALTYKGDGTPMPPWAERAKKAHYNAIENLIPFAALVLVADSIGATNDATAAAAMVYFWARLAHYVLYAAGVPFGRTISFAVGWASMACIFYHVVAG